MSDSMTESHLSPVISCKAGRSGILTPQLKLAYVHDRPATRVRCGSTERVSFVRRLVQATQELPDRT